MLRSRRRRNRIAFAFVIALVLSISELSARLYLVMANPRVGVPAGAVAEIGKLTSTLTQDGYWVQDDFHGAWYNIDNGARRTAFQPDAPSRTLWLFGNSSLFDPYADDAHTMASQLQAMLNESGYRWRVVNLGASGQLSSGELARLKLTNTQPGDIVVFIDGSTDMATHSDCSDKVAMYAVACGWYWQSRGLKPDVARYERNILSARAYAGAHGLRFYQFVQPFISIHYLDALPGLHIYAPDDDFVDSAHLNAHGDSIVARALFDALTLI